MILVSANLQFFLIQEYTKIVRLISKWSSTDFPLEAPIATLESNIVCPNIDYYVTGVCLNLLLEWSTYEGEPNVV